MIPDSDVADKSEILKLTTIKATLNVYNKSGVALSYDEKIGNGRVINLQSKGNTLSRAKITLKCEPADYVDKLTLESINDKIKLFDSEMAGNEVSPFPLTLEVGSGKKLPYYYVEGVSASDIKSDTGLKLKINSLNDTVDSARLTVLKVKLVIYDDNKNALSEDNKTNPGCLLLKQNSKFYSSRVRLSVIKKPKDAACDIVLKAVNNKVKLYPAENKMHVSSEISEKLPRVIKVTEIVEEAKGIEFWAEGSELTSLGESVFSVDVDGVDDKCDEVYVSVAEFRNGQGL